jgi:hypothetical protein
MAYEPALDPDIYLAGHGSVELHSGYYNVWRQLLLWAGQEYNDECGGEDTQLDGVPAGYSYGGRGGLLQVGAALLGKFRPLGLELFKWGGRDAKC